MSENQGLEDFEPMTTEEATLVTLMRIYDVLLGMYSNMDEVKAEALMELHALGQLLGPVPAFDLATPINNLNGESE